MHTEALINIMNAMSPAYDCSLYSSTHTFCFKEFYPNLHEICHENNTDFAQFSYMLNSKLHILDYYHSNQQTAYFSSNHPIKDHKLAHRYDFYVNTINSYDGMQCHQLKLKLADIEKYSMYNLNKDIKNYHIELNNDKYLCVDISRQNPISIENFTDKVKEVKNLNELVKAKKLVFHKNNIVSAPKCNVLNSSVKYLKLLKR